MTYSTIRDNHSHGTLGDFLKKHLKDQSNVAIVSAYFTLFAYQHLKENLDNIDELRLLFGEPTLIKFIDLKKSITESLKLKMINWSLRPLGATQEYKSGCGSNTHVATWALLPQ